MLEGDHVGSLRVTHMETQKSVGDTKSLGLAKLVTHKSTRSLAHGLKINAGRPDILSRPDSVQSHSAKNQNMFASNSSCQFKNRLQSKYGISAQSKLLANGSLPPASTKNSTTNQTSESKQLNSRPNNSRNKNLKSGDDSSNSKFTNPYIVQRNTQASKHLQSEAELHISRGSFNQGTKSRFRDCSEHAALQSRDFKTASLSSVNQGLRINRRISDSVQFQPTVCPHERLDSKLKAPVVVLGSQAADDSQHQQAARDTAKADIMNQVKSKYRNPYNTKGAGSQQASKIRENLRI